MRLDIFPGVVAIEEGSKNPSVENIADFIKKNGRRGLFYVDYLSSDSFEAVASILKTPIVGILVGGLTSVSFRVANNKNNKLNEVIKRWRQILTPYIDSGYASNARKVIGFLLKEYPEMGKIFPIVIAKTYRYVPAPSQGMRLDESRERDAYAVPRKSSVCEIIVIINGEEQDDDQITDIVGREAIIKIRQRADRVIVKGTNFSYTDGEILYKNRPCDMTNRAMLIGRYLMKKYNEECPPIEMKEIIDKALKIYGPITYNSVQAGISEFNKGIQGNIGIGGRGLKFIHTAGYGKGYVFDPNGF